MAYVHTHWLESAPTGMGRELMTKTVSPAHYDESLSDHPKSMILLRAWALWRAGRCGFSGATPERKTFFQDAAERLAKDARKLGPFDDGCLGHPKASAALLAWAPAVAKALAPC